MLGLFKKKNKQVVTEAERSLSRMDRDIYLIQQWISHLHEKGEEVRNSHFRHIEVTKKDISEINKWIRYLHTHNSEIHKFVRETTNNIIDLRKSYNEIAFRLEKIEKGQLRTLERTNQGQIEDKSALKKDTSEPIITSISETERKVYKTEFNGSQLELLNLMYHADRPFSYEEMAKMLGKKKKSIRNLIYELREKNINVKSKPTGVRKKGFYLDKEEKIKVSGR